MLRVCSGRRGAGRRGEDARVWLFGAPESGSGAARRASKEKPCCASATAGVTRMSAQGGRQAASQPARQASTRRCRTLPAYWWHWAAWHSCRAFPAGLAGSQGWHGSCESQNQLTQLLQDWLGGDVGQLGALQRLQHGVHPLLELLGRHLHAQTQRHGTRTESLHAGTTGVGHAGREGGPGDEASTGPRPALESTPCWPRLPAPRHPPPSPHRPLPPPSPPPPLPVAGGREAQQVQVRDMEDTPLLLIRRRA